MLSSVYLSFDFDLGLKPLIPNLHPKGSEKAASGSNSPLAALQVVQSIAVTSIAARALYTKVVIRPTAMKNIMFNFVIT